MPAPGRPDSADPVNALVLTYASLNLANRSSAYWATDADGAPAPAAMGAQPAGI